MFNCEFDHHKCEVCMAKKMFQILKRCLGVAFELSVYDTKLYHGWIRNMMEEEGIEEQVRCDGEKWKLGEYFCPQCGEDELVIVNVNGNLEFKISDYCEEDTYHCGNCDTVYEIQRVETKGHVKDIAVP